MKSLPNNHVEVKGKPISKQDVVVVVVVVEVESERSRSRGRSNTNSTQRYTNTEI